MSRGNHVFLIARMSSSRLPGKCLMPVLGKPLLGHMIERIQKAKRTSRIVITTSTDPADDALEDFAGEAGVDCFRGSLLNVMERIQEASEAYPCETIVEILGDNPLVHSSLIDEVMECYENGRNDYAATLTREYKLPRNDSKRFALGIRVQVYSKKAAGQFREFPEYVRNEDKHPCAYLFEHPERFRTGFVEAKGKWALLNKPEWNLAVNYQENFDMVRRIFETLYPRNPDFSLNDVFRLLEQDSSLSSLMGRPESLPC